jgi:RNA polymerase sigma-70 factor (sigma-E family)
VDFERYVRERGPALERYAFVLVGDPHLAQDLTQAALLKAYLAWRRVVRADHPDVYVRRILTNTYLDRSRLRSGTEVVTARTPDMPSRDGDPADGVSLRDQLHRALAQVSPGQRAVLVLRHLDGYDDATIARVLGCSTATVRSHASRGLARMRELVGEPATDGTGGTADA